MTSEDADTYVSFRFREADANKDGKVSMAEFTKWFESVALTSQPAALRGLNKTVPVTDTETERKHCCLALLPRFSLHAKRLVVLGPSGFC